MTPPPAHWRAEVLAKRRAGQYAVLTIAAPGSAEVCRPGHYGSVSVGRADGPLLRRQVWVGEVSASGRDGGTMEIVVDPAEPGGRRLAAREQGSAVDVIAPLGRPFSLPRHPVSAVLVALGSASAALIPLARRLVERGCRVTFVFAGDEPAYGVLEARRVAAGIVAPEPGRSVSDALAGVGEPPEVVYSAGSPDRLRQVAVAAERWEAAHQAAIRTELLCGAGTCTACALPVRGRDGVTRIVRACVEGPVFNAELVRWHDLGTIPGDCLGAPAAQVVPAGTP